MRAIKRRGEYNRFLAVGADFPTNGNPGSKWPARYRAGHRAESRSVSGYLTINFPFMIDQWPGKEQKYV